MANEPTEQSLSAALQRVLLPAGLPDIEGWAVATLYEPAGNGILVGGDFYDWFTLPDGGLLFFLGDVSGKGPLAGALGMSIRKALKGITWVTGDALTALPVLEQALAEEFGDSFATLCLLELQPSSGALRLLLAGHPPPWLRRGGVFREVDAPTNGVLGPGLQHKWQAVDLVLDDGDMLLLFTDGLTEAVLPGGQLFGEGALEQFLHTLPPRLSSYETVLQADAHLRRVAGALADDVIIGVLTYQPARASTAQPPAGGELLAVHLAPHSTSVRLARRFVHDACRTWATGPEVEHVAQSVASELVTNAVLHARTDLELRLRKEDQHVRIEVRDRSTALPTRRRTARPQDDLEHGRGLDLVRLLGAEVHVEPAADGKLVWAVIPL